MGSSDWGGKPALFCEFDTSLDLILEKTTRLAKFLSERAQAKIDYSKKLKEISQKHQQKYNHIKESRVNEIVNFPTVIYKSAKIIMTRTKRPDRHMTRRQVPFLSVYSARHWQPPIARSNRRGNC